MRDFSTREHTRVVNHPPPAANPAAAALTPRESQILALLARDTQAKEIAAALGTSVHTVRNQIEALYKKLGVHSRMAALITVGFLTPPPLPEAHLAKTPVPKPRPD